MNSKLLESKFIQMLEEDVGSGDITSRIIPRKIVRAEIIANEECIISGIEELRILFNLFDIKVLRSARDGEKIKRNQRVFLLSGNSHDILIVERTALNLLSRMSGISTTTKEFIEKVRKIDSKIRVAATRKTTPLLRYFEKKAIMIAGGDTHRIGLYDAILIKHNHLRLFNNLEDAIRKFKKEKSFIHKIEIEVDSVEKAVRAAREGVDVIMFDNMTMDEIREAISILKKEDLRDKVILEASGGINLSNIEEYAKTGVDIISIGSSIYSAKPIDFSLRIVRCS
ncbi:MAG: carboxylating nicotinate-nucleotide diphosphorylase [Candidatus Altiarchaeales archaeon]|nr:MAG: carboxylating nicotinate-nucleotide diphosphorylase [Candidatus Altiarchaeales archaeon]HDO81987.1 carboxylating nicotinate-nucleotide diphosphorylase [Candidatus Altiarchaeales archaeon]HEX54636.1 carboxylating nicotinate-nucleotide diphosphorylase [Candidatus Altiarchaeales archaeon]